MRQHPSLIPWWKTCWSSLFGIGFFFWLLLLLLLPLLLLLLLCDDVFFGCRVEATFLYWSERFFLLSFQRNSNGQWQWTRGMLTEIFFTNTIKKRPTTASFFVFFPAFIFTHFSTRRDLCRREEETGGKKDGAQKENKNIERERGKKKK